MGNDRGQDKWSYFLFFLAGLNFLGARPISVSVSKLCHRTPCSQYLLSGLLIPETEVMSDIMVMAMQSLSALSSHSVILKSLL